jgi:hypothetical protein
MVESETVFACLLRVFSIRRDVTSFFRSIWKPLLPAVLAVLNNDQNGGSHVFVNIISVTNRLLECIFQEKLSSHFPPIVIGICQHIYEVGGNDALHHYLFNFLIFPNLIKILAGDHNSSENEDYFRLENVNELLNKYYDHTLWSTDNLIVSNNNVSSDVNQPFSSMLWVFWRIYTLALCVHDISLATLTTKVFAGGRLNIDISGVVDQKLRSIISRLRRKIFIFCKSILEINTKEINILPVEMSRNILLSNYELESFFTSVGIGMELHEQSKELTKSSLYQSFSKYFSLDNTDITCDEKNEVILHLVCQQSYNLKHDNNDDDVFFSHKKLLLGLQLTNKFEDSLYMMLERIKNDELNDLYDLVSNESNFQFNEFDLHSRNKNDSDIKNKHTKGSSKKVKRCKYGLQESNNVMSFFILY